MGDREDAAESVATPEDAERDAWADEVKDRLTKSIEAKGWSQRELGRRLGITGSAISQRLGRERAFREWWRLAQMARELEISADYVLGLSPDQMRGVAPAVRHVLESSADQLEDAARRVRALVPPTEEPKREP